MWDYRAIILIPASDKPAANALWTIVGPEGGAEAETFTPKLSASGASPATWYGVDTSATAAMRALIELMIANELSSARVYICDKDRVLEVQHNGAQAVGQVLEYSDILAEHSLRVIEVDT